MRLFISQKGPKVDHFGSAGAAVMYCKKWDGSMPSSFKTRDTPVWVLDTHISCPFFPPVLIFCALRARLGGFGFLAVQFGL